MTYNNSMEMTSSISPSKLNNNAIQPTLSTTGTASPSATTTTTLSNSTTLTSLAGISDEFTVILLAGGLGHRMYPLLLAPQKHRSSTVENITIDREQQRHPMRTNYETKALLPIANRPMIVYSLEWLESAGFQQILVVTRKNSENSMRTLIYHEFLINSRMNIEVIGLDDDWDGMSSDGGTFDDDDDAQSMDMSLGTAEILRKIRPRIIAENVMIVSSDVICDVPLHPMIDMYRTYNSILTALFFEPWNDPSLQAGAIPKKPLMTALENRVFLGVDARHPTRWLYVESAAEIDEELQIYMPILRR
jgi:hypothetical protein